MPERRLGPVDAFVALWAFRDRVEVYLRSHGADETDVDDVVAETYGIAWRRLGDVPQGDREALRWLIAVARRAWANARRSTHRQEALKERLAMDRSWRSEVVAEVDALRLMVADVWSSLPEQERRLLSLSATYGMPRRDLAQALGSTDGAVATRLSRIRARLRADSEDFL